MTTRQTHLAEHIWTRAEALSILEALIQAGIAASASAIETSEGSDEMLRATGRHEAYSGMLNQLQQVKAGGYAPDSVESTVEI